MESMKIKDWVYVVTKRMCMDCYRTYATEAAVNMMKNNPLPQPRYAHH
jgi:hypothetical protein